MTQFLIILGFVCVRGQAALRYLRFGVTLGTRRLSAITDGRGDDEGDIVQTESSVGVTMVHVKGPASATEGLPFTPASLAWRDIGYSVPVTVDKKKTDKVLLAGVSGAAPPGKMVALMGATGGTSLLANN